MGDKDDDLNTPGTDFEIVETTARRLGASQTNEITGANPQTGRSRQVTRRDADRNQAKANPSEERLSPTLIGIGLLLAAALIGFGLYASTRALDEKEAAVFEALGDDGERIGDSFDREQPSTELNASDDGLAWSVLGPPFTVAGGSAFVEADQAASIALVDTGWSDVAVGLTVGEQVPGSGLIFRSVDLSNYWSLVAVPEFATWNLVLMVDGQVVSTTSTGLNSVEPGTRISVATDGPEIRVFVNGAPALRIVDPSLELATNVGLLAALGGRSSFDEFFVIDNAADE